MPGESGDQAPLSGRHRLETAYAFPTLVFLICAIFAGGVASGETLEFDKVLRGFIHGFVSTELTELARMFTFIGSSPVWGLLCAIGTLALWFTARRKQALVFAAVMSGAVLLDNGLKIAFRRVRPEAFFGALPNTYSFPSGHALFALCFYGTLAIILTAEVASRIGRIVVWACASLMVLFIGWSRIYLGVHYPSDVVAGLMVGTAWLAFVQATGAFRFAQIKAD